MTSSSGSLNSSYQHSGLRIANFGRRSTVQQLVEELDTAYVTFDGADLEAFNAVEKRDKRGY